MQEYHFNFYKWKYTYKFCVMVDVISNINRGCHKKRRFVEKRQLASTFKHNKYEHVCSFVPLAWCAQERTRSTRPIDAKLWKKLCLWIMFNIKISLYQTPPHQRSKYFRFIRCVIFNVLNKLNMEHFKMSKYFASLIWRWLVMRYFWY